MRGIIRLVIRKERIAVCGAGRHVLCISDYTLACFSQILFGYDLVIISGAQLFLEYELRSHQPNSALPPAVRFLAAFEGPF